MSDQKEILYEGVFLDQKEVLAAFKKVRGQQPFPFRPSNYHVTTEYLPDITHEDLYGTRVIVKATSYKKVENLHPSKKNKISNEGFGVSLITENESLGKLIEEISARGKNWHITGSYLNKRDAVYTNDIDFSDAKPVSFAFEGVFCGITKDHEQLSTPPAMHHNLL